MLSPQLKTQLLECLGATFDNNSFQQFTFTREDLFGIDYNSTIAVNTPFDRGIAAYVDRMEKYRKTCYFVKEYYDAYKANALVAAFFSQFQQVFSVSENEPFRIRGEFLDCLMVNRDSLPFVGRENVKEAVYKLLNKEKSRITLLDGESRSGLSYIRWYLMEIAAKTDLFEVVYINLKKVFIEYAKSSGLVYAAHIASFIADTLDIVIPPFDPDKKELFKITPFLGKLKIHIEAKGKPYLFFIDQFDVLPFDDVPGLMQGIADLSVQFNDDRCYVVLSGYKDTRDWSSDLVRILNQRANKIRIDSFTRAHLDLFFRKIYIYLSALHDVDISLEDFLAEVSDKVITADIFEPPNAEKVGTAVSAWYERFVEENA